MVLLYNLYQSSLNKTNFIIIDLIIKSIACVVNMPAFKSNSVWTVITQTQTAEHFKSIDVSGTKVTAPHDLSNYPGFTPLAENSFVFAVKCIAFNN